MNRQAVGFALAFASGVAFGTALTWTKFEHEANKKYMFWVKSRNEADKQVKAFRERHRTIQDVKTELKEDLEEVETIVAPYVPTGDFILIDEAEYYKTGSENDKITIEVYRDDLNYQLVVDGDTVIDWRDILTPTVLDELVGQDSLFVRNTKKGEDYLVTWGRP